MNASIARGTLYWLGTTLALLSPLPGWSTEADASPPRAAHASSYAVTQANLERNGEPSVSGRFRLSGSVSLQPDASAVSRGTRFGGHAMLTTVADCSDYIFADTFDE